MSQPELQDQLIKHIDYVFNELNQVISLIKDDKMNTALMCLGIVFHQVSISNKSLDIYRSKPEPVVEAPVESPAPETDISPVV